MVVREGSKGCQMVEASIGAQGFYALPLKEQKQKGEIGKRESSHMPCEKASKERCKKGLSIVLYIMGTSTVGWMLSLQASSALCTRTWRA